MARGSGVLPASAGALRPQVEVWLNRVLDRMCATLRHEIPEAVVTYEEKPREQWIFDYPAQVGRVGEGPAAPREGRVAPRRAPGPRGDRSLDGRPAASRWRSRARRSGGPRRWAWRSPGWRKATRTRSKTTTRSRCVARIHRKHPGSHRGAPFPPAGSLRPWQPPRSRPGGTTSQIRDFNFLSGNHQVLLMILL